MLSLKSNDYPYLLMLFCVLALAIYANAFQIDLYGAFSGYSPKEFVDRVFFPDNFIHDSPSGVDAYSASTLMHVYTLLYSIFGLDADITRVLVIIFEVLFFAFSCSVLVKTITPGIKTYQFFIIIICLVSSSVHEANLGRWSGILYWGLFYTTANSLRILAIAYLLQRRVALSAYMLALSITVHPVMGFIGAMFCLGVVASSPREYIAMILTKNSNLLHVFLSILLASAWLYFMVLGGEDGVAAVSVSDWIAYVKAFNFHFFPFDIGVFTNLHQEKFFPFLSSALLVCYFLYYGDTNQKYKMSLVLGLTCMVMLILLGLYISLLDHPYLIKLALTRASGLFLFVSAVIIICGLLRRIVSGGVVISVISSLLLVSLFWSRNGFPLIWVTAFFVIQSADWFFSQTKGKDKGKWLLLCLTLLSIIIPLIYYFSPWFLSINMDGYTAIGQVKYDGELLTASIIALILFQLLRFKPKKTMHLSVLSVAVLAMLWAWELRMFPSAESEERANDYMQLQIWVDKNLSKDVFIMPEPTHYYGFKHFAKRSSFGNLRGWLHGIVYTNDGRALALGIEKAKAFGVNPTDYLSNNPSLDDYKEMHVKLGAIYNSASNDLLISVANKFGITHFVMNKSKMKNKNKNFSVIYENENYILYGF
ncbi:MAG: hypothetical protein V3T17_01085 [Pseudomonadales bacterium]